MTQPMKILRVDSSAKTENSENRRLTDRIIGITDVTFISADKHLMDDQSVINANAAVDALTNRL